MKRKSVTIDGRRRAKTINQRDMQRIREEQKPMKDVERFKASQPKTRGECVNGPRPCLYVSCKYNLYLDVNPNTGSIKINFPDLEIWEMPETCALDLADKGGMTLDDIGKMLNLTRERIRQYESTGLHKLKEMDDDE